MRNSSSNTSVLLVGNGPSATSWQAGQLIDSFDLVVRFNRFNVKGYEQWVGNKTDVWVINGPEYNIEKDLSNCYIIYSVPLPMSDQDLRYIASLMKNSLSVTVLDENVLESAKRRFHAHQLKDLCSELPYPSTGAIVTHYLLGLFPVVYIHGFDCMQGEIHHYFEDKRRDDLIDWHNPSTEKAFFESLIMARQVYRLRNPDLVNS